MKDALKSNGWLDQRHIPGNLSESRLAFALTPGTEDAVRTAVEAREPPALAAISSIEKVELAAKKAPAPQKKPAQSKAAPPPRRAPKPQERSFGGGSCSSAGSTLLPPAEPVRLLVST